jgi:hypothetical protein
VGERNAILTGFAAWRQLRDNNSGIVTIDAANRTLLVNV